MVRAAVKCLFDYRDTSRPGAAVGEKARRGQAELAEMADGQSSPAPSDWGASISDASPGEADYALIRLEEEIGDLPVRGTTGDAAAIKRGWICQDPATPALVAGNLVFLLQHPTGEPLQLTVGTVKEFNSTATRVRYDANSKNGSSGSPCFDADLQLVALHHARDPSDDPPKWNQAIPFGSDTETGTRSRRRTVARAEAMFLSGGPQTSELIDAIAGAMDPAALDLVARDLGVDLAREGAPPDIKERALILIVKLGQPVPPKHAELLDRLSRHGNVLLRNKALELLRPTYFPGGDPRQAIMLGRKSFYARPGLRERVSEFLNPSPFTSRILIVSGQVPGGQALTPGSSSTISPVRSARVLFVCA